MAGMVPLGKPEFASDPTTAALLRRPGSETQTAFDERIRPVVDNALENDPSLIQDVASAAAAKALDGEGLVRTVLGKNLFDPSKRAIGYSQGTTGVPAVLAGYSLSDYIPVKAGQPVALNAARNIALFNSARVFVAGSFIDNSAQGSRSVTPTVDGFLRAAVADAKLATFQVESGSTATTYEPFYRALDPNVAIPDAAISGAADAAGLARVLVGKNLYNPATDALGVILSSGGVLAPIANYRTSDFIPVEAAAQYTMSPQVRAWGFFNRAKNLIGAIENISPQAAQTRTAPADAAYLRISYLVNATATAASVQVEKAAAATAYEPYRKFLDPTISMAAGSAAPLGVGRVGSDVSIATTLGLAALSTTLTLGSPTDRNGVMNFLAASVAASAFHTIPDSIAPIRTQQGTIGANHGFAFIGRWASHDKTTADLGSVWTDGSREYVLLKVDGTGAWFGGSFTTAADGSTSSANVAPTGDLTHVSGATHTASLPQDGSTLQQLYPAIANRVVNAMLDSAPLATGRGNEIVLRESYEILDYSSLYTLAKANIGVPYTQLPVAAAVRVESEWRIRAGLKMLCYVALTEVARTALGQTGFFQTEAMNTPAEQTRFIPGVKAIGGRDYSAGVAHSALTVSENVTAADLHNPAVPPTVLLDWRQDIGVGFALGYEPWTGATSNAARLANSSTKLWDLRDTRKIYPNAILALAPGWGRVEARGYRAYVTAAERDQILARKTDALAAAAALRTIIG